ncbi:unnamed protein product [Urochloa decumbens]|uniref:Uncharacterized protein n=1 Tax=Urochloa decumbens TaxID=240449 RepID=A0ABC9D7N1_9POAL
MDDEWQNNDAQGTSLNPGNETVHPFLIDSVEEYDMDALLGAEDHVYTDQDDEDEEHNLQGGKSTKRGKRFTAHQIKELELFTPLLLLHSSFQLGAHPNDSERQDIADRIGLDARQVKFWFQNRRNKTKVKAVGDENKDIKRENAQLHAENMILQKKLLCGRCCDRNDEKCRLLDENARLKDMKRHAQEYLLKLMHAGKLPHSKTLELLEPASLNLVPFIDNDSINQATHLSYAERALNEFVMLAMKAEPMWLPTSNGKVLNEQEYKSYTTFPELLGPCPQGFVMEASKWTTTVRGTASNIVGILTDIMFPGIIGGVRASCVISTGILNLHDGLIQEMNVDFSLQSPRLPNRSMKFLRYSKQIENSQWAVVDVSMDGTRGIEPYGSRIGYMSCRLLPSGCLLEDLSNGRCKVTWIVHVEYDETTVQPIFRQFFQSGQALGASRWLASLQRQCEYMAIMHSSHSSGAAMSALGRRSVLELAQRMMTSFYTTVSKPVAPDSSNIVNEWRGSCEIGTNIFEATVRMVIWNCSTMEQPPSLVLSATTTVWLPGMPPHRVHEYLCNVQRRGEWDRFAYDGAVEEFCSVVTCRQLPGNAVSVFQPSDVTVRTNSNMMILQEATSDASCSLLVYSFTEMNMMRAVMDGYDNTSVFLLPSGFAILPDGHGPPHNPAPAATSSSAPTSQNHTGGSFLTAAYQAVLPSSITNHATQTLDDAGNRVCQAINQILAAVGADIAIPA